MQSSLNGIQDCFYIYYKEGDHVWNFSGGGERNFKGWKLPFEKSTIVNLNSLKNKEIESCTVSYLKFFYGKNYMTPIKKNNKEYYVPDKTFFGEFPDKWLIPLK